MSVSERYEIAIQGARDGLAVAGRLAQHALIPLRWATIWSPRPFVRTIVARFGSRLNALTSEAGSEMTFCVRSPTLDEVRSLISHVENERVCIHWNIDDAPGKWIPFVDVDGRARDDARVHRIELGGNAIPFTYLTWGDAPSLPAEATGWRLQVELMRDHFPQGELPQWLAVKCSVLVNAVTRVEQ